MLEQFLQSSLEFLDDWWLAALAFLIVSGAINALVSRFKRAVSETKLQKNEWFQRSDPLQPVALGLVLAPFVGPYVVPVDLPILVHLAAGVLMGAFAGHSYEFWRQTIKKGGSRLSDKIVSRIGSESDGSSEDANNQ